MTTDRTYTVGHLFAGCGGGGDGFHRSRFGWRGIRGRFRTVFGIDSDGPALRSFERLTDGPGVELDLFSETFVLSSTPHWARPLAVALSCRS